MQVFLIGAGGYLGSALCRCFRAAGHTVVALARSQEREIAFRHDGLETIRGDLSDHEVLASSALKADATIFAAAVPFDIEMPTIRPILENLSGTKKPFILTTGTAVLSHETPHGEWREENYGEDDPFTPPAWIATRVQTENFVRSAAKSDVRAMVVRPPLIWGHGGSKQIPAIFDSVRKTGSACYIGAGLNLYSHVHVDDLADVYRLAIERGVAGALYHAVAGEANFRALAEAAAQAMGTRSRSVSLEEAKAIWGDFIGPLFFGVCSRSRAPRTRRELGWEPRHLDAVEDVRAGSYRDAYAR
ncbi:MAG TPA: NAD-dependent epimerase/dehydratase family protein [Rhizomicrobium sp.]|nr:NAD-dependent epimerase/dehydratase family protein [Rhizomicrobium sp.]